MMMTKDESSQHETIKILLCGGIAGIVTWASVFPLDVIKTRLQTQVITGSSVSTAGVGTDQQQLLRPSAARTGRVLSSWEIARAAARSEGLRVFYRGLGICSLRAFIVNAVQVCFDGAFPLLDHLVDRPSQWATYEWIMKALPKTVPQLGDAGL
jgi:solute carrier family 25 carnitine/acylcarnitine transporter 20/29